jgi:hypothetical protein
VKLVLLEEAQQQFEEQDAWWRDNRDAKGARKAESTDQCGWPRGLMT